MKKTTMVIITPLCVTFLCGLVQFWDFSLLLMAQLAILASLASLEYVEEGVEAMVKEEDRVDLDDASIPQVRCMEKTSCHGIYEPSFFSFPAMGKGRKLLLKNVYEGGVRSIEVVVECSGSQSIYPCATHALDEKSWSPPHPMIRFTVNRPMDVSVYLVMTKQRVSKVPHLLRITFLLEDEQTVSYSQTLLSAGHKYETGKKIQAKRKQNIPEVLALTNGQFLLVQLPPSARSLTTSTGSLPSPQSPLESSASNAPSLPVKSIKPEN